MKPTRRIALILLIGVSLSSHLFGQETTATPQGKNMLGIRISSKDAAVNHSITYKRFFRQDLAVEGLFSFTDPGAIGVMLEQHHQIGNGSLRWFDGGGLYYGFHEDRRLGLQGVVGLDILPASLPFNLSLDWKPELNLTKNLSFEPAAVAFSARFVF